MVFQDTDDYPVTFCPLISVRDFHAPPWTWLSRPHNTVVAELPIQLPSEVIPQVKVLFYTVLAMDDCRTA